MLERHTELLRALQTHSVVFLAIDNSVIKLYNMVVPVEQENPQMSEQGAGNVLLSE